MSIKSKVTGLLGSIIGVLIIFTPFHLAPVCQGLIEMKTGNMAHMRCHYTGQAEVYLGILTLIISLMILFSQGLVRRYLGFILAALGVIVILMPTHLGIGVCMSPMECHTTAKFLYVYGGLLTVGGLVLGFTKVPQIPLG
ncbi:DUF4418 family protein [Desulfosporosinus meridiei]|uniref:DUF4418 domain-containing protein n=1 Tax=Desulfosporosinus meridiei (strain ATCC BAA-275 / DSM 13257 / KCTC 12902 / NCIMB 13706 / S10) TaxID=768704 RepID=J7J205_DESMD|nr:DUF4418 family protein [Desulfosporosinus meridiei]AFQ45313.1 hypothetical protein Desmer_3464 [Desulfosporosinus meridiei DSM 13257]